MFKYFISIAAAALLATSMLGRTIWASFQPEDTGGIVYGGNYQGNEFTDVGLIPPGKFVIHCTHMDMKGNIWSTY